MPKIGNMANHRSIPAVQVQWEDYQPPLFVETPPVPELYYSDISNPDATYHAGFAQAAHSLLEPLFGTNTHNLVAALHRRSYQDLVAYGYDSTCCEWDGGPYNLFTEDEQYRRGWTCRNCGERLLPQVLCSIPVRSDGSDNPTALLGSTRQVADYFNTHLRNRTIAMLRTAFEEYQQTKHLFEEELQTLWEEVLLDEGRQAFAKRAPFRNGLPGGNGADIGQLLHEWTLESWFADFLTWRYGGSSVDPDPSTEPCRVAVYWRPVACAQFRFEVDCFDPYPEHKNDCRVNIGAATVEFPPVLP